MISIKSLKNGEDTDCPSIEAKLYVATIIIEYVHNKVILLAWWMRAPHFLVALIQRD